MGASLTLNTEPPTTGTSMPGFPESLGPFKVVSTPLSNSDFRIQPKKFGMPASFPLMGEDLDGTKWVLDREVLLKLGLEVPEQTFRISGQFSPRHQVTLSKRERRTWKVPTEARTFVWSYPVENWQGLAKEKDPSSSSIPSSIIDMLGMSKPNTETPAASSFFTVGGFTYVDKDYNIVGCTTLMSAVYLSTDVGMHFNCPKRWREEWTAALHSQKRFQEVTIKALVDVGARYFCWLKPGEYFPGCKMQPRVPHGGFVYLWCRNVEDGPHPMDRYFAVVMDGEVFEPEAAFCSVCTGSRQDAVPFRLRSTTLLSPNNGKHRDEDVAHRLVISAKAGVGDNGEDAYKYQEITSVKVSV